MRETKPSKTIWVTREGEGIRVRDMSDGHLLNTVAMLRRNAERRMLAEAIRMSAFVSGHGDTVAADAVGEACAELADMSHDEYLETSVPTFAAMLDEIERRGLA